MNTEKRSQGVRWRAGIGVGTISLLVIFTILCFSTLALLSLTSAHNNQRIHSRGLQGAKNISQAEGVAAKQLAQLDYFLAELQAEYLAGTADISDISPDQSGLLTPQSYYQAAYQKAESMGCTVNEAEETLTFSVPIDKNSELVTTLRVLPPGEDFRYTVIAQYAVMTGEWAPDNSGHVWPGN